MNAYELAWEQAFKEGELSMWTRNDTATMLRQQADRIAELEKELSVYKEGHRIDQEVIADLQKRNAELFNKNQKTYPLKQLSDEEIEKLQQQFTEKGHFADTLNVKEFARAIIKEITE